MAYNVKRADAAVNAEATAVVALLNGGKLRLYTGTQPATADTAAAGTLLAELTFANPAISGSPSAGVATLAALTADGSANADGTPTWFRALKSDDTPVFDGTVGLVSGYDCIIDAVPIVAATSVSCTVGSYTANKG